MANVILQRMVNDDDVENSRMTHRVQDPVGQAPLEYQELSETLA